MDSILKKPGLSGINRVSPNLKIKEVRNLRLHGDGMAYEPFGEPKDYLSSLPPITKINHYSLFYVKTIQDSNYSTIQSVKSGKPINFLFADDTKFFVDNVYGEAGNIGWSSGWIDKLEWEGPILTGSSTTASELYADTTTPLRYASNNFYYRGWYAHVRLSGRSNIVITAKVLDYDAATGKLQLESNAISGVTAGTDQFWLSRSLFNGYAGNYFTASGAPIFSDSHLDGLRVWFDDNKFYPDTYNFILTGINRALFHGDVQVTELGLSVEQFPKPWLALPTTDEEPILTNITPLGTTGSLEAGTWRIAFAFVYDGYQIGKLSDYITFTISGGEDRISFDLIIPFNSAYFPTTNRYIKVFDDTDIPNNFARHLIDRRITGINFYLSPPSSDVFHFARHINFANTEAEYRQEFGTTSPGYYPLAGYGGNDEITEDDFNKNKNIVYKDSLRASYGYSAIASGIKFVSSPRTEDKEVFANAIMFSNIDSNGIVNIDSISPENIINLSAFSDRRITRILTYKEPSSGSTDSAVPLIIVTDKDMVRIDVNTRNPIDWQLKSTFQNDGSPATNGFVFYNGLLFYFANGKRYMMFDGNSSQEIAIGLGQEHKALITKEDDCIGFYDMQKKLIGFIHPSDGIMVLFDFAFGINQQSVNFPSIIDIDSGIIGADYQYNNTILYSQNKIFYLDRGFGGLVNYREAKLDVEIGSFDKYILPNAFVVVYNSDTGALVDIYDDDNFLNTLTLSARTGVGQEFRYIDATKRMNKLRFVIRSRNESANTVFKIIDVFTDIKQENL